MRPTTRKTLLWQGIGLLFYLAGMALFLIVAVGAYLAPPENSLENLALGDMLFVGLAIALIVAGRAITWKFGADASGVEGLRPGEAEQSPEQSRLQELGYHVPPESTEDDAPLREGDVVCPECGTENDGDFTYCANCSAELPD